MHEGVTGPSKARLRCVDRLAWLPTKPTSWLCSFASCGSGQSPAKAGSGNRFAPLLALGGPGRRSEGSWSPPLSASRGKRCFPRTPSNRSGSKLPSLHWWFSVPGASLRSSDCGSPVSPRKRGGRESLVFPLLRSWAPLVGRRLKPPIVVRRRQFSRLAPRGGRESFLLLSLTGRELCSLPDHPSNRRAL